MVGPKGRVFLPLPFAPNDANGWAVGTASSSAQRGDATVDSVPGDDVEVILAPEGPQRDDLAEDFRAALESEPAAAAFFDNLAQFYRNAYLRWIDATADRGYGQTSVDDELGELGVELVAILRKGQPGKARQQVEAADGFVELVKWRTGAEGRIAALKRQHGWGRARLRGLEGARTWCGWGVLSHNAIKIAALSN